MPEVIWQNIVALIAFILSIVSPHICVTARNPSASSAADPENSLWRSHFLDRSLWRSVILSWSVQEVLDLKLSAIAGLQSFAADVAEFESTTACWMVSKVSKRKQDYALR
jgi:hypothetical protein